MIFDLNESQQMVRQMVQRFGADRLAPLTTTLAHEPIPEAIFGQLAALGFKGARVALDQGGSEMDALSEATIIEVLAGHDAGLALALSSHNLAAKLLSDAEHASTREFIASDRWLALARLKDDAQLSTPHLNLELEAVPAGARITHLLALSAQGAALCVLDEQRCQRSGDVSTLGFRAVRPHTFHLKDALIERLDLSQASLKGAHAAYHAYLAAAAVGVASAAYEQGARYAHEREQFSKRLTRFQITQFKLADMATRLQGARHLMRSALASIDEGDADLYIALQANAFAARAAAFIADEALQLHGGCGYTSDYPVERQYRDAVALRALGGGPVEQERRAGELLLSERV